MKRMILALTFLLATSSAATAQFTPSKENLRGLTGVTLMVMFHGATRAEAYGETRRQGLEELQRPEVLKMLEDDMKAKLEKAGIPFPRSLYADNITKDYPRLIVSVRLSVPNGFVYPLEAEVKLLQRVRLVRDPSIEFDAVSWSLGGTGNMLELPMLRRVIAGVIDSFIRDYLAQNPKQSASVAVATKVSGQAVPSPFEPQQATLFSRIKHQNQDYGRSAFNFQHGVRSDDEGWNQTARGHYHLLYGSISIAGDSDWFSVPGAGEDSTRIKDLGALQWSEVYFTPFLPANPHASRGIRFPGPDESMESSSDGRVTKVVAGHMYVVHIKTREADFYVMFRVDELVPSDKCEISWKLVTSPEEKQ